MKIKVLKNGVPSNDYGWTESELKKPNISPDMPLSDGFETQRAKVLLALIAWIKAHPKEKVNNYRVEYDPNLQCDILLSRWQGKTYEFYVEE